MEAEGVSLSVREKRRDYQIYIIKLFGSKPVLCFEVTCSYKSQIPRLSASLNNNKSVNSKLFGLKEMCFCCRVKGVRANKHICRQKQT